MNTISSSITSSYEALLQEREALDAKIEQARKAEMTKALAQVRALVSKYQMTESDIFGGGKKGKRVKVPPKYRDPVSGKTWSGRGRAPKWIDGKDREQFLIK